MFALLLRIRYGLQCQAYGFIKFDIRVCVCVCVLCCGFITVALQPESDMAFRVKPSCGLKSCSTLTCTMLPGDTAISGYGIAFTVCPS